MDAVWRLASREIERTALQLVLSLIHYATRRFTHALHCIMTKCNEFVQRQLEQAIWPPSRWEIFLMYMLHQNCTMSHCLISFYTCRTPSIWKHGPVEVTEEALEVRRLIAEQATAAQLQLKDHKATDSRVIYINYLKSKALVDTASCLFSLWFSPFGNAQHKFRLHLRRQSGGGQADLLHEEESTWLLVIGVFGCIW